MASWHKGASRSNYLEDAKGQLTGDVEGSWQEVYNINQGISDYTFGLIMAWVNEGSGENTVHKRIHTANTDGQLKQE